MLRLLRRPKKRDDAAQAVHATGPTVNQRQSLFTSSDLTPTAAPKSPTLPVQPTASEVKALETYEKTTQSLAQRLQELAVSFEDGLIGEDEYRLLRQQVFSAHVSPDEPTVLSVPSTPPSITVSEVPASRRVSVAGSIRSRLNSRLARPGSQLFSDSGIDDDSESASVTSRRASALSYRPARTVASSVRRTSAHSSPKHRSGSARFDNDMQSDASYSSHIKKPSLPSSTDPAILASAEKEPSSKELKDELVALEAERRTMKTHWLQIETSQIERWSSKVDTASVQAYIALLHASRDSPNLNRNPPSPRVLRRRSSLRPSLSDVSEAQTSLPGGELLSADVFLRTIPSALGLSTVDISTTAKLVDELRDVRQRAEMTDAKYAERCDYLRARLRGALIREKVAAR